MDLQTQRLQVNESISIYDRSQSSLFFYIVQLALIKLDNRIIECHLMFKVGSDLFQHINTEALFNFNPEIRVFTVDCFFKPETDIHITIALKNDLLSQLIEQATDASEAASYLIKLSQEQPDHPLVCTESWLLLSATQSQEFGEVGYRTLWDYLSPSALAQASESEDPASDALFQFFKDWSEHNVSAVSEKLVSDFSQSINHLLAEFSNINLEPFSQLIQEIEHQLKKDWQAAVTKQPLLEQVIHFFTQDDWSFSKPQGESYLQLAFQGKNGAWTCYAQAREEKQQFVFYSVAAIKTPEDKRQPVSEFLAHANYGMIIGNFELDFNDGEIRYKTSIDVEGDRLTPALIKQLVYTNVLTMDQYLPGIQAVLEGTAPAEAIRAIEIS
ncbi:MAG: YbjN domain-containing protein [Scytolyngbya sp. HA4215-MV1]|nr:YbjN domain-containing protein [Scytolyngbya sp. HA4215-MV1]